MGGKLAKFFKNLFVFIVCGAEVREFNVLDLGLGSELQRSSLINSLVEGML